MFVPSNTLYACPSVLYFNLILIYGEDVLLLLHCHVLGGSHPIVVLVDLPPVATAEGESSSEEEEEEERPTNSRTSSTESSQLFSVFSTLSTRQPSTRQGKQEEARVDSSCCFIVSRLVREQHSEQRSKLLDWFAAAVVLSCQPASQLITRTFTI